MSINYTPRTWATGEFVTAAMMNAEVRDPFTGVQAAWETTWDPGNASNWTAATTNPVIGNGTSLGYFLRYGKLIFFAGRILPGSTTTFGAGTYTINLPVASNGSTLVYGPAQLVIAGTRYIGACVANLNGFAVNFHGAGGPWNPTVPATFASGSSIHFAGHYPAA